MDSIRGRAHFELKAFACSYYKLRKSNVLNYYPGPTEVPSRQLPRTTDYTLCVLWTTELEEMATRTTYRTILRIVVEVFAKY